MRREYGIARLIIVLLSIIISFILLINEDVSTKFVVVPLFVIVALIVSLIGTKVSQIMIKIGDKINGNLNKFAYYLSILILIFGLFVAFLFFLEFLDSFHVSSNNLSTELGYAISYVLFAACIFIMLVVPYVETLIVLALRKILDSK